MVSVAAAVTASMTTTTPVGTIPFLLSIRAQLTRRSMERPRRLTAVIASPPDQRHRTGPRPKSGGSGQFTSPHHVQAKDIPAEPQTTRVVVDEKSEVCQFHGLRP